VKLIRPNKDSLILRNLSQSQIESIVELFTSNDWNADYEYAEYPNWESWSERIPLTTESKRIPKDKMTEYMKPGVYEIYREDELIYVGETRSSTRNGMWARRSDFRSTVRGGNRIKNPYGNGTKFLELFSDDLHLVTHRFHYVHPLFCKKAELELLNKYYEVHQRLPVLHDDIDYNRTIKQMKINNTATLEDFFT